MAFPFDEFTSEIKVYSFNDLLTIINTIALDGIDKLFDNKKDVKICDFFWDQSRLSMDQFVNVIVYES